MKTLKNPPAWILLGMVALMLLGMLYDRYIVTPHNTSSIAPHVADNLDAQQATAAPDFAFTDIDGKSHHLRDFTGKLVLLNFWATWCAPCATEFPQLVKLAARHHDDVILIALASDRDERAIHNFLAKQKADTRETLKNAPILIALDQGQKITRDLFMTQIYPETFIINSNQQLVRKVIGNTDWLGDPMEEFLRQTLKKETP